jgi:uncharacterized lipoprotein YehR (DUF1307 family)
MAYSKEILKSSDDKASSCFRQHKHILIDLNGTHQQLVYTDDVNLLGDNMDTIQKNTQTLIDARKKVGIEVNAEKTKYMSLSRHQNTVRNHDMV